jgi:hypothetical protein
MAPKKPANSGKDWTRGDVAQLKKELKSSTPTRDRTSPEANTRGRAAEGEQPRSFNEADKKEPVQDRREAPRPVGPGGRQLQPCTSWRYQPVADTSNDGAFFRDMTSGTRGGSCVATR